MKKRLLAIARRATQSFVLLTLSVTLTLVLLEFAVRLVAPQQLITLRPDIWQPTEGVGWRHRADADTVINTGDGPARIITDGRGHRIGAPPPPATPDVRILALGDSFLEAIQVDYADTFAARIEATLAETLGTSARVTNTGVGGWGPDQYLIEARDELARQSSETAYDVALVFVYLPNDRVYRRTASFPPRQAAARRGFRLPNTLSKGELVDAVAYPINDLLERRSHLFTLLKHRAKFLLMRFGLSAHYFPAVLSTAGDSASPAAWTTTTDVLRDIRDAAAGHGIPTLFVLLPGVYQVDAGVGRAYAQAVGLDPEDYDLDLPSRVLGDTLRDAGLDVLDTLPTLRQALAADPDGAHGPLYGSVDTHFAPAGHAIVADAVLERLVPMVIHGPEDNFKDEIAPP